MSREHAGGTFIHANHKPVSSGKLCGAPSRARSVPVSEFLKWTITSARCEACIRALRKLGRWPESADTKEEQANRS